MTKKKAFANMALIGAVLIAALIAIAWKIENDAELAVCRDYPNTKYDPKTNECLPVSR